MHTVKGEPPESQKKGEFGSADGETLPGLTTLVNMAVPYTTQDLEG